MNSPSAETWAHYNSRRLAGLFEEVRRALAEGRRLSPARLQQPEEPDVPARIDSLAEIFGLGQTDLIPLILAAAQELEPKALGGSRATVAMALTLGGADVHAALCAQAPLRRWRIIEVEGAGGLSDRFLRLDERIAYHLLGIDYIDARLDGLMEQLPEAPEMSNSEAALISRLHRAWVPDPETGWPVLELCGSDRETQRAVAVALTELRDQRQFHMMRADIPRNAYERLALARLCDREMALSSGVLLIEGDSEASEEERFAAAFVDTLLGPTIVAASGPLPLDRRRRLRADMGLATGSERRALWERALGRRASALGEGLDRIARQFPLDSAGIRAVASLVEDTPASSADFAERLWDAARVQARRQMSDLAERIESAAGWKDIILPADRIALLHEIAAHVRHAHRVHDTWGWADVGKRGLGITALFTGPSGTGKTLAAEVLATELRLDLYRIDLSQVVSKYIGETEKNLRRIFEAAETSGAILLFDEADALFGRRSDVKDSHDRYANIEVGYLLQRMEAYRGLAILTTNLKSALDPAFMRRLRFVVDFPFPGIEQRREIWRHIFPAKTPTVALDYDRLSRLVVSGGTIRNIAVKAAFLAAEGDTNVTTDLVLKAARQEYAKLDKPVPTSELGGHHEPAH